MMNIGDLLRVAALSETDQATYFPHWTKKVPLKLGEFDIETNSARMVALCCLAHVCRREGRHGGEIGGRLGEIQAICQIMIESSGVWPWMVWHPTQAEENSDHILDPEMYRIWAALRRLAGQAASFFPGVLLPFSDLFSRVVSLPID